jgi:hypothetical protein
MSEVQKFLDYAEGKGLAKGGVGSGRHSDPAGQKCPKCGKEFHDNKWGGTGKCDCGYYFHPEWYGKPKSVND